MRLDRTHTEIKSPPLVRFSSDWIYGWYYLMLSIHYYLFSHDALSY